MADLERVQRKVSSFLDESRRHRGRLLPAGARNVPRAERRRRTRERLRIPRVFHVSGQEWAAIQAQRCRHRLISTQLRMSPASRVVCPAGRPKLAGRVGWTARDRRVSGGTIGPPVLCCVQLKSRARDSFKNVDSWALPYRSVASGPLVSAGSNVYLRSRRRDAPPPRVIRQRRWPVTDSSS